MKWVEDIALRPHKAVSFVVDRSGMSRSYRRCCPASVEEDCRVQKTVGQKVKRDWECSQIEDVEEEEGETQQKENRMDEQWAVD